MSGANWQGDAAQIINAAEQALSDGHGLLQVVLFCPEDVPECLAAARGGDRDAKARLDTLELIIGQIKGVHRRKDGPTCALCKSKFWRDRLPQAFALLHGLDTPHRTTLTTPICRDCQRQHPDRQELFDVMLDFFRNKLIPELRVLPPMAPPGRA